MPEVNDALEQPATAADIAALVMLMGSISSRLDETLHTVHRLEGLLSQAFAESEAAKLGAGIESAEGGLPAARGSV